ncbi:MAG: allophanate hydrolase [Vulcanimicrobiaceae bacterium]
MIPAHLSASALRAGYRDGSLSPEAVFAEVLARVAAYPDPAVWIARVPEERVLARARALPRDAESIDRLPLYGLPFAVKDNIDVEGMPTTAGCPAYAYDPQTTAFAVARLLAAGAILIGKTNLDQFATGLVGTRSPHGAPRSVFDPEYISGGSSSGSAVAVAAGLCAFALGTDTAGSGRVPAAFNGIVGLKPTRGIVSTSGVVPACRSLDCVSIFAPTVADARAIAAVAHGFDPGDPYGREAREVALPTERLRCGVLATNEREFFGDTDASELYARAIERARSLGLEIVEFDFAPFRETARLLYDGPWVAERLAAIEEFFARHADAIDPTVRAIVGGATAYSAVDAFAGRYRLRALERRAATQWASFDVMLLPTAPTIYRVAEVAADPIGTNARLGTYTNFVNLLDYCAVAVPAGVRHDGLPFGVSFVAPAFADGALARLAERFENARRDEIALAVAGAHLSGFPLNAQLTERGAMLRGTYRTAPGYRLFALANTTPPKPGLVRDPALSGDGIEVEVWTLAPAAFGTFVAALPQPMGIGRVTLADGSEVAGFLCERYALDGATEVTSYGGWRAYRAQHV